MVITLVSEDAIRSSIEMIGVMIEVCYNKALNENDNRLLFDIGFEISAFYLIIG